MTIRNALILAAGLLALTLGVNAAEKAGWIGEDAALRVVQVAVGLMVVYYGNLAPKTLEPMRASCPEERVQAIQRFSGWTLVLGGLGYSASWLFLPLPTAGVVATAVLATATVLVLGRLVWVYSRRGRGVSSAGS